MNDISTADVPVIEDIFDTEDELSPDQQLRNELNALPIEELNRRIIALALLYGADAAVIDNDPAEALDYLDECRAKVSRGERTGDLRRQYHWSEPTDNNPEDWALYRAAMRVHALSSQLLGENDGVFQGEFHGSGDRGNYEINTGDALIDNFLEKTLDRHVTFDWCNNDGGYGDITWEVRADIITINGNQYVTETVSVMDEEEF